MSELKDAIGSKNYDAAKSLIASDDALGLPALELGVWQQVQKDKLPGVDEEGNETEPKDVDGEEYQAELAASLLPDMPPVDAGYLIKAIIKIGLYVGERAAVEDYDKQFDTQVGDKTGFGVFLSPAGDVYAGSYAAGLREGEGALRTKAGTCYVGQWKAGKRHGAGSMTYADGGVYTGAWAYGKRHGTGTFFYKGGDSYVGEWHAGEKHGAGKYMSSSAGTTYEGTWKYGTMLASKLTFATADNAAFYGAFDKYGRPSGPGSFTFGNGVSLGGSYLAAPVEEAEGEEPPAPLPAVWHGAECGTVEGTTDATLKKDLTSVKPVLNVIIAGAPASGKGTQCEKIVSTFGLHHLSTGDLLRAAAEDPDNADGQKAKELMEAGELVPDDLIIAIVAAKLNDPEVKNKGWLLDGFPRTEVQAKAMEAYFLIPSKVVLLDVPNEVLLKRVTGRRLDPETGTIYHLETKPPTADTEEELAAIMERLTQRADDTEEALTKRLDLFAKNRDSVAAAFSSIAKTVDGNRDPAVVWDEIKAFLE